MKRMNTSPISGMQELLPESQADFNRLKVNIQDVYTRHGYVNIETPMIDRCEILLAKAGGDTEKQIYKVVKTAESNDDADQALRFDHTVPLARYVVEHENDLAFPFKVSQIGRNFRGERAQKGRFREFYQCDIDVIGRGELPLYYDADVIATLLDTFSSFGLNTPVVARISNRKILTGLIEELNVQNLSDDIYSIIDHCEKVPAEKTVAALDEIGLSEDNRNKFLKFMELNGDISIVKEELLSLGVENSTFKTGVEEISYVIDLLKRDGFSDVVRADMRIVRGLDYYTGTVFEFNLPEYRQVGSVCGGGRYENLAGYFTDLSLPGVGGSIGLTRLFYVLNENSLVKKDGNFRPVEYAVVPITDAEIDYALEVARDLRADGKSVTVVISNKKLGDKLRYATKVARRGIVIGEDEANNKKYRVKEF